VVPLRTVDDLFKDFCCTFWMSWKSTWMSFWVKLSLVLPELAVTLACTFFEYFSRMCVGIWLFKAF